MVRNKTISTMQKNKGSITWAIILIALFVTVYFVWLKPVDYYYDKQCLTDTAEEVCYNVFGYYKQGSLHVMLKDKDAKFICINDKIEQLEYFTIAQMKECERKEDTR